MGRYLVTNEEYGRFLKEPNAFNLWIIEKAQGFWAD
jgi:hypothetical protein